MADRLVRLRTAPVDRLVAGLGTQAGPQSYDPLGIRVRGVALLVMWVGGLVVPLGRWGGLVDEDAMFLLPAVEVGLLLFAAGLLGGSQLGDRFRRRAARPQAVGHGTGERP